MPNPLSALKPVNQLPSQTVPISQPKTPSLKSEPTAPVTARFTLPIKKTSDAGLPPFEQQQENFSTLIDQRTPAQLRRSVPSVKPSGLQAAIAKLQQDLPQANTGPLGAGQQALRQASGAESESMRKACLGEALEMADKLYTRGQIDQARELLSGVKSLLAEAPDSTLSHKAITLAHKLDSHGRLLGGGHFDKLAEVKSPEELLIQQAYMLKGTDPDQALSKIKQVFDTATKGPDRIFYQLRAVEFLRLNNDPDTDKVLESVQNELVMMPSKTTSKAEFLLETGMLWNQMNRPHDARPLMDAAAREAVTVADQEVLFKLSRLYDTQPATRQDALWCMEKGLEAAFAKRPDPLHPADLSSQVLDAFESATSSPLAWKHLQRDLPKASEQVISLLSDISGSDDAKYLRQHAQDVLELGQRILKLEQNSLLKTPFPFDKASLLAQKGFEAHLAKPDFTQAQGIAATLNDLAAHLSPVQPEEAALVSKTAAEMQIKLQTLLNQHVDELVGKQKGLISKLQQEGLPAGQETLDKLIAVQNHIDSGVENLIHVQDNLLQSAFVMARSNDTRALKAANDQLMEMSKQLNALMQLPSHISIQKDSPGFALHQPAFKLEVLDSMVQTARFAVEQHQVEGLITQLKHILDAEQQAPDPSLYQAANQLILDGARYLLSRHDSTPLINVGRDLLVTHLPRFTTLPFASDVEPSKRPPTPTTEDLLEIARLLQPVAPEKAAELAQPLAVGWLKSASLSSAEDPDKCLEALSKSLDAIRLAPTKRSELLPELNKGLLFVIKAAGESKDTELLRDAMQLARVYVPKDQLALEYPAQLISLSEGFAATDPGASVQLMSLAAAFSVKADQLLMCAEKLGSLAVQALKDNHSNPALGQGNVAMQACRQILGVAYRLNQLGSDEHLKLAEPLGQLMTALNDQMPTQQVKALGQAAQSLFQSKSVESASLSGVMFTPSFDSDFQPLASKEPFKFRDDITRGFLHKQTTVLHYRSEGHPPDNSPKARELDLKIDKFVQVVSRKSQMAYEELKNTQFTDWDVSKGHYARKCLLKNQWDQVKKAYKLSDNLPVPANRETEVSAVFYDLQRVLTIGKKGPSSDYDKELAQAQEDADNAYELDQKKGVDPLISADERFITARMTAHADPNAESTKFAASESVAMLSTLGGYLIEERTYQLLKADTHKQEQMIPWIGDKVSWTDQDTDILGGTTRPDLTLKIPGEELHLLMDFTAFNSQGHIYGKTPRWTDSNLVADSVEVLYPSMTKHELKSFILEGKALTEAEIKQVKQAYEAEKAAIKERQANLTGLARSMHYFFKMGLFDKEPEMKKKSETLNAMGHLCKRYGLPYQSAGSNIKIPSPGRKKTQLAQINLAMDFYKAKAKAVIANPAKYGLNVAFDDAQELVRNLQTFLNKIDPA